MNNVKCKMLCRLLSVILSITIVFSVIPFSMITYAAMPEHQDSVTITVVDKDTSQVIKDAMVEFVVDSVVNGKNYIIDSKITDENGVIEVMPKADFISGDFTLNATVTANNYKDGKIENQEITAGDDNFCVSIETTTINDVIIKENILTYNGAKQDLVSVTAKAGDIVTYRIDGGEESEECKATDAKEYSVEVIVKRDGKNDLKETVYPVINKKDIEEIDIEPNTPEYNEKNQPLVTLYGAFHKDDIVTWEINEESSIVSHDIPQKMAVGEYSVKLTIDRGSNYNKFTKEVEAKIINGKLDIEGLDIKSNNRTYDKTAQEALIVANQGAYDLEYRLGANGTWEKNTIPKITDAGTYEVYVKATKDGYNEQNIPSFPIEVTIEKAEQSLKFDKYTAHSENDEPEEIELKGTVPYNKTYDFSASDKDALASGTITYKVELDEDGIASIDSNGLLKVFYPGSIKVIATLTGNENYKECIIEYNLKVSGEASTEGQYISFENSEMNYVFGTSDIISEQIANKNDERIKGKITYSMKPVSGVSIDTENGKITVDDYNELALAIRKQSGSLETIVTATKEKRGPYGKDMTSYKITICFEAIPENPYTLPVIDGLNGWYKSVVEIIPTGGYSIAQEASGLFTQTTTFSNQGVAIRYIYLKNNATGAITDQIPVNIKIDTEKPSVDKMEISYSNLNLIEKIGKWFGFYNPDVEITFTVNDEFAADESGVQYIDWSYTKDPSATSTILAEKEGQLKASLEDGKYVARLLLKATEIEQFRGNISFRAIDFANNDSDFKADNDMVIVIDTINPKMSATHELEDANGHRDDIDSQYYYDGNVKFAFFIEEANFFEEDVNIMISKNGADATVVDNVNWVSADEEHIGTFYINGDGDYVVTMTYKDQSGNDMVDAVDANKEIVEYTSDVITIDETVPVVQMDYNQAEQKTTFMVTEHNFRASDVKISDVSTMKDINDNDIYTAEQLTALLQSATWTSIGGDKYIYETDHYVNGIYNLKIDYTDISGNSAEQYTASEFIIDHDAPTNVTIEYAKSPIDVFFEVITLGFYNPSVTVRFTAYDDASGVESFTWNYTKENGASDVNRPTDVNSKTEIAVQDSTDKSKYTATIILSDTEAKQLRGYLAVYATDKYKNGNEQDKVTDSRNIIVVDTVAPEIKVEYSTANYTIDDKAYYNENVDAIITVTEANFYAEDVHVYYSKDNAAAKEATVSWFDNSVDEHIGTFSLSANTDHSDDGDYIITIEYYDRSKNGQIGEDVDKDTHIYIYSKTIVIDTTNPVINVEYLNQNVANTLRDSEGNNRAYFGDTQTAKITITERNFDEERVLFTIEAKDANNLDLNAAMLNSKTEWDSNGENHTIFITYPGDANYIFDIECTDIATNKADDYATDYFTVDTHNPFGSVTAVSAEGRKTTWEYLEDELTFGFWSKEKITISGTSSDETSPIDRIEYYMVKAVSANDGTIALTETQLDEITAWIEFYGLDITSDEQVTVYIKITDSAGNYSYISTNGLIVDSKSPVEETIAPKITVEPQQPINGLYNGDVKVDIKVMDPLTGGTYSGLKTINYKVLNMGVETQSGTLFEFKNTNPKQSELVQTWTGEIIVDSKLNNSNDVKIVVWAEDNALNSDDDDIALKIDITAPTIEVAYDNNNADSTKFFKDNRTATIIVTERNFNAEDIRTIITNTDGSVPTIGTWEKIEGTGNLDDTKWVTTIKYNYDGDYTFDISYIDLANNACEGAQYGASVAPREFTIDKTVPTVQVSYNNNNVLNTNYYNAERVATVVINEHNLEPNGVDKNRVVITMTATDEGTAITVPTVSAWTTVGDKHTATIKYSGDALYTFDVDIKDKAGNVAVDFAQQTFYVDKTAPTLTITGVANNSANNGEVIPVVSYSDTNYDAKNVEITLSGVNRKSVVVDGSYSDIHNGRIFTFKNFANEKDIDDIYTLTATLTDKAGNTTTKTITFSVNRFGSTYALSEETEKLNGTYVKEPVDVVVSEINVNELSNIVVTLFKNNETIVLTEGTDYNIDVTGGNGQWYHYTYTIFANNFEDNAVYSVTVESNDAAGNEAKNDQDTKNKSVSFGIDDIFPIINIENLDSKTTYALDNLTVNMSIEDNLKLAKVIVELDGKEIKAWNAEELEEIVKNGGNFSFDIAGDSTEVHNLVVYAIDAAGNGEKISDTELPANVEKVEEFYVTTNLWVRYYTNKPLFFGSIAGAIFVTGLMVFIVVYKKKKDEGNK